MMAKLHERQHEFAVRTAIGAGRLRPVRQYLAESFVIALAGAPLGAALGVVRHGLAAAVLPPPEHGDRALCSSRTTPSSSSPPPWPS